jgi:hypothetical protein
MVAKQVLNHASSLLLGRPIFSSPLLLYHPYLVDVASVLGSSFDDYLKFTVVRHPLSLQLSLFTYSTKNRLNHHHSLFKGFSFSQYIEYRTANVKLVSSFHCDTRGITLIDRYIQLESLSRHLAVLCDDLHLPLLTVPRSNVSRCDSEIFELDEAVYSRFLDSYKKDYDLFGYDPTVLPSSVVLR